MSLVHTLVRAMDDCGTIDGTPIACDPGFGGSVDSGPPGWWVAGVILIIVLSIGGAVYRMSVAKNIAAKSGMDGGDAANVALLEEDGLAATYVMANLSEALHGKADGPAPVTKSAEERLAELASLRDRGVITQAEYDEQRAAILDTI